MCVCLYKESLVFEVTLNKNSDDYNYKGIFLITERLYLKITASVAESTKVTNLYLEVGVRC